MKVLIGLGSNVGARRHTLRRALELLSETRGVGLLGVSFFYETEPWGVLDQRPFVNAAALLETSLEPLELLDRLQSIEAKLGRVRLERWGPRTIDLDILLIEGVSLETERLTVPHPLIEQRAFVQVPMRDLIERQLTIDPRGVRRIEGSPKDYRLKLIACVDRNWGLGLDGRLLFRIEEDMKRFRSLTLGSTVIMGRRTFDSIGKELDGRRNIIMSRRSIENVETVGSVEELFGRLSSEEKNYVIGGGEIYRALMPFVEEAFVTAVDRIVEANVRLSDLDGRNEFELISSEPRGGFEFREYRRRRLRLD